MSQTVERPTEVELKYRVVDVAGAGLLAISELTGLYG